MKVFDEIGNFLGEIDPPGGGSDGSGMVILIGAVILLGMVFTGIVTWISSLIHVDPETIFNTLVGVCSVPCAIAFAILETYIVTKLLCREMSFGEVGCFGVVWPLACAIAFTYWCTTNFLYPLFVRIFTH